jgi:formylglycine-generating enzyme required for sulfatase activity
MTQIKPHSHVLVLALVVALLGLACGSSLPQLEADARALQGPSHLKQASDCALLDREIDLLGWSEAARGQLSSLAAQGTVVVRYSHQGCEAELRVLSQCVSRSANYQYTPYAERRSKLAETEAELHANFPLGAYSLKGSLAGGRVLRADYQLAGVQRLPVSSAIDSSQLSGDCAGATHVVTAIYRGAFAIAAASREKAQAETQVIGGTASRSLSVVMQAGSDDACRKAGATLTPGCDVPLRVELVPLATPDDSTGPLPAPRTDRPWSKPAPKFEAAALGRCPKGMVAFAGGPFTMGSDTGAPIERPAHPVEVPPFCLDEVEVTAAAYQQCIAASICQQFTDGGSSMGRCNSGDGAQANHPRNCVEYEAAEDYCFWVGKRLPTEAEWEFAAKAGARNLPYPTGDKPPTTANACIDRDFAKGTTCPVASKKREPGGVFDLAGNVSEYASGGYVQYAGSPDRGGFKNSTWLAVSKGGNYYQDYAGALSSSHRGYNTSGVGQGFRCAF